MKKALLTILCLIGGYAAMAQMSEEKIAQYILEQQEKGVSQEQIVMDLSRRGVTLQQLQQMRSKYEKGQSTGIMGNTLADESMIPRIRTSQQTLDTGDGLPDLQSGAYDKDMAQKMRLQNMYDESMFLFVDSIELLRLSFIEKKTIFGHDMFNGKDLTFEPSTSLATPRNYRLGPGDEVIIDIWGASQSTVRDVISPDGNIMVDGLGPLYLNGMTVDKADSYIKKVFSQIYSGVSSQNGESSISLSLGQNRSIVVNVLGEVENPGTYTISSFASMFNALYMAGGPTEIGSLRNVKLYRGGKMAASLDVYDFLFNGTLPGDITLQDNDVVMVPAQTSLVCIDGSIRRPMFYEMKQGESLGNLIEYAGGLAGNAYRNDVRVIRMGDVQRSIHTVAANEQSSFAMFDGDSVYVDSTQTTFSNMAEVRGAVFRPGMFQTDGGIKTVRDLVKAAGGLREDAFPTRALLSRTNPDLTLNNQAIDIQGIIEGRCSDVAIQHNDVLFIPSHFDMGERKTLSIFGEVMFPGDYHYADNTSIEDMVLQAGGLKVDASVSKIDVVRRSSDRTAIEKGDTIARVFSFSIDENLKIQDGKGFVLKPYDEIYVRRSPGYSENRKVLIEGEVLFPGYYSLSTVNETLSDVVKRAGLFTSEAYPSGARLERKMTQDDRQRITKMVETLAANDSATMAKTLERLQEETKFDVGISLEEAMNDPHGGNDIQLRDGDRIVVPPLTSTVKINGAVMYSNTISYVKGKGLTYYIDKAGGFTQNAKKRKVYIMYMNGTVERGRRRASAIQPGCEIIVPEKLEKEGMSTSEILSLSSTSASLATVVLALINLIK